MLSNRLAFGALGIACITAAAGGGYLASRQDAVPTPAMAAGAEAAPTLDTAATPEGTTAAVQETEAVVGEPTPSAPVGATEAAPPAAPARQRATTPRAAAPASRSSRPASPPASAPVARQEPPALERTWPSSAASDPQPEATSSSSSLPAADPIPARVDEPAPAAPSAPEPPQRTFEELVVAADSVIGLQTNTALSSERARVEDRVEARVTRDVRVNDRVAIPAGTKVIGTVTVVEQGGKFKERARLGIRFNMLVLDDGTELPISTETIYRDGEAPNAAQKVGGAAVGGAILGAIIGGGKGAVLGGLAGAGGGAAVTMAGDRKAATLAAGAPLTVRITAPVTVTVDKES
jgi:hypothetical protein